MMAMSTLFFSIIYGLITLHDPISENGGLFLSEYLTMKTMLNLELSEDDLVIYRSKMDGALVKKGLYRRDATKTEREVSHDEVTGFIVGSKLLGTKHADEVWSYLVRHLFIYNANGNRPYPAFNPNWIYHWGNWCDSRWTWILYPYAFASMLWSTSRPPESTSSKLVLFVLLKKDSFMWKVYSYRMRKMYGDKWIAKLFSIYFWTEPQDHPLIYLSNKL